MFKNGALLRERDVTGEYALVLLALCLMAGDELLTVVDQRWLFSTD